MIKKVLFTTVSSLVVLAASNPVFADQRDNRIAKLEIQLLALMDEVKELKQSQKKIKYQVSEQVSQQVTQNVAKELSSIAPATGKNDIKITIKPSPKFESADGQYSFQPFGRVHLDYTAFDDDMHNHPDNSDWRRARFGFKGKLGNDLNYKYEMDLADASVAFKEVYLQYTGFDAVKLKIGHFKPFQGLNELNSSNYISLIERAAAMNVFARGETTGVAIQSSGDAWSAHLGLFGEPAGSTSDTDDEDVSVAGRVSLAPFAEKRKTLHLGASASVRSDNNGAGNSFSTRGETGDGDKLINTGTISEIDMVNVYGLELAATLGAFHAQAEYLTMDISRDNGLADADFSGWYTQLGYILTGESRPYKSSSGTFGRIKPQNHFNIDKGTWGAFEVVGRVSNTDLNDTGAGILGGELDVITAGANWYLNNNVRVMANYRKAETDVNSVVPNDEPKSFSLRAQFDF